MGSYNRQFRKKGCSFYVQNCFLKDMKSPKDKYYLTVMYKGIYRVVHDAFWEVPKFASIREAHAYASACADEVYDRILT